MHASLPKVMVYAGPGVMRQSVNPRIYVIEVLVRPRKRPGIHSLGAHVKHHPRAFLIIEKSFTCYYCDSVPPCCCSRIVFYFTDSAEYLLLVPWTHTCYLTAHRPILYRTHYLISYHHQPVYHPHHPIHTKSHKRRQ
jgi:hypothetical protein